MSKTVDEIVETINEKYGGVLNCEEQRADLFVYIDGQEESIKEITTTHIHFEDSSLDVELHNASIHHLAYIKEVIVE